MNQGVKAVTIRLQKPVYNALKLLAEKRGESIQTVGDRIITLSVLEEQAIDSMDVLSIALTKVVRRELKPVEERMAKLAAKIAVNSGTSLYLNYYILKEAFNNLPMSAKEIREEARKKAVAELREPMTTEG